VRSRKESIVSIAWANRLGLSALAAVIIAGGAVATPRPAQAQNFFESLFGGFSGDYQRRRYVTTPAYAPPAYDERSADGRFPDFEPRRPSEAGVRGHGTHCVRMCDGRYFPVPTTVNGVRLDPAKVCSALCPAAQTKVFNGGNMEYARANDGTRYADLDSAFAFRDRIVPDCSCTGQGPGGLAQIDVESDPTLRAGDVVVTASGPTVFRGSSQFPYKTADFTPVEDYRQLHKSLRDKLSDLQVNTAAKPALPPQRLEAGKGDKPVRTTRQTRPRVQTSEQREFPAFAPW
jgi:hypothetical protein